MNVGESPDRAELRRAIFALVAGKEEAEARLREYEEALIRLIRGDFGFVGHVNACRVQVGDDCTCGFSDVRERLNAGE